ncbi:MAG: hypothetical protein NZO58_07940 [Gemmataceae bacterium]|nr:hypothetical protein [Gemmataceae bacterium]
MSLFLQAFATLAAMVATGGGAPTLSWDKCTPAWSLPWEDDWVTAVAFVGNSRLVAGNEKGDLLVWELPDSPGGPTPRPVRRLVGHDNGITRLVAAPDGRWLLSASKDRTIATWDLQAQPTEKGTVVVDAKKREAAAKKAGKKAAPPEPGVEVLVQKPTRVFTAHKEWILGLALSKDGKTVLSGDDSGLALRWDFATGKVEQQWKVKGWVFALALSPVSNQALISERIPLVFDTDRYAAVKLWDSAAGKMERDLTPIFKGEFFETAAYSPDGKILALGRAGETEKAKIVLLDPASGKKLHELPGHIGGVNDMVFAADGKHLLTCGRDTVVRVWNVVDGKQVAELGKSRGGQFKDVLHAVALSPDQRWVAAADMAGIVQVWRSPAP